jgi:hypothetical protein
MILIVLIAEGTAIGSQKGQTSALAALCGETWFQDWHICDPSGDAFSPPLDGDGWGGQDEDPRLVYAGQTPLPAVVQGFPGQFEPRKQSSPGQTLRPACSLIR